MSLFWIFSRQSFYKQSVYRLNFWMGLLGVMLELYVVSTLWNVLFQTTPKSFANVSLSQMITYGVLGILISSVLTIEEGAHHYMQAQIRMGQITSDILKPVDFMTQMMARDFGTMVVRFCFFLLPPFVVAYFVFHLELPHHLTQIIGFVISMCLAWVILFFCNFLFGLISFKTLDLLGFIFTYYALIRFASGELIPLWMYPSVLQPFLQALPFQSIYYTPLAIFTGVFDESQIYHALWVQCAWVVGLFLFARFSWSKIHRSLVVQGG